MKEIIVYDKKQLENALEKKTDLISIEGPLAEKLKTEIQNYQTTMTSLDIISYGSLLLIPFFGWETITIKLFWGLFTKTATRISVRAIAILIISSIISASISKAIDNGYDIEIISGENKIILRKKFE